MSENSEVSGLKDHFKKSKKRPPYSGASRRATSMLPELHGEHGTPMPIDGYANRQRLLVSIEANKATCCVKFSSEKVKSRGAILVYQGRVLGTLYGVVGLQVKLYQQEAYPYVVKDLLDPDTKVTAWLISEPLAIATGALFHGQFSQVQGQCAGRNVFGEGFEKLIQSRMPGCVLVNDQENVALLSAFLFDGRMVALYSGREGWLPATPQVALQHMAQLGEARVSTTVLPASNIEEVLDLTFSLSGLADRTPENRTEPVKQSDPSMRVRVEDIEKLKKGSTKPSSLVGQKGNDPISERELFLGQHLAHLVDP